MCILRQIEVRYWLYLIDLSDFILSQATLTTAKVSYYYQLSFTLAINYLS